MFSAVEIGSRRRKSIKSVNLYNLIIEEISMTSLVLLVLENLLNAHSPSPLSHLDVQPSTPNYNLVFVTILETLQFRKRQFQEKCLEHVSANMI